MTKDTNPLTGQPLASTGGTVRRGTGGWKLVIVLIIGFALGFGASWLWVNRPAQDADILDDGTVGETGQDDVTDITDGSGNTTTDDTVEGVGGEITVIGSQEDEVLVKDQIAGESVFITRATLTQDGWVAVQEILPSGQLGNILGAKRFNAGVSQGMVTLLRSTRAGNTYVVTLWYDNGDGVFDHTTDALVTDGTGAVVAMEFEAYSTLSE